MHTNNKTKHFTYSLFVRGLWGRNRKEKFETWTIARSEDEKPIDAATLRSLAEAKANAIGVKHGKLSITEYPLSAERHPDGIVIDIVEITSGRTVIAWQIDPPTQSLGA